MVSELVVVDIAPVTYQQESMDKNLPSEAVYAMAKTKPHQCKSRRYEVAFLCWIFNWSNFLVKLIRP